MKNSLISNSNPDLLTLEEAATLTGKTSHNIRDYIQRGRIAKYNSLGEPVTRAANGDLRVSKTELQTFLRLAELGQLYRCSFRRNYGELEEDFETEIFATDETQACILLFAELSDINAATKDEAISKASQLLAAKLGSTWTVEDFLNADLEVWPDNATYFTILNIVE